MRLSMIWRIMETEELKRYSARFTTNVQTCLATNQVVADCEKLLQKVERSCTFCSKLCSCCTFYEPKANLFCSRYGDVNVFPLSLPLHPFKFFLLLLQFLCNNSIEMRSTQATNQNKPYLLIGHKIVLIYAFTCSVSFSYSTKINLFNAEFIRAWRVRYIWSLRLAIASKYKCSDADLTARFKF